MGCGRSWPPPPAAAPPSRACKPAWPACGCGNFLVVAYRELRLLEHEILERLYAREAAEGKNLNLALFQLVGVGQVAGLEVEEFAARIAEVALWLMDHQLNLALSARFEQRYVRLPLVGGAEIHHTNALTFDWQRAFADGRPADFIVGNPPFGGQAMQSAAQKASMAAVAGGLNSVGALDFVAGWYLRAGQFLQRHPNTQVAFVSTNSITQGEQVAILWAELVNRYDLDILFAHRTFKWSNEARGNAAVYCIIVGLARKGTTGPRQLFDYATPSAEPQRRQVSHINPYLVDAPTVFIPNRSRPLSPDAPPMIWGNNAHAESMPIIPRELRP